MGSPEDASICTSVSLAARSAVNSTLASAAEISDNSSINWDSQWNDTGDYN